MSELKRLAELRAHGQMTCAAKDVLDLIAENELMSSELYSPDEIVAEPVADYEGLRKQFLALRTICNSKSRQVAHWRRQSGDDVRHAMAQTAANVSSERDTNAMLTDALEVAETERDKLRAENAGLRTGYEAYERVNAELRGEVEGLRKAVKFSAETFRTITSGDGSGHADLAAAVLRIAGPCMANGADAAMSKEAQS
jgi:hypothetical protein